MDNQDRGTMIEEAQKALDDVTSTINSTSTKGMNLADESIVQTDQKVESRGSLYNRNASEFAIRSASDAIADLAQSEILNKTQNDFLVVAKKVMDGLDVIKDVYPVVAVAVVAFKAVVNFELQRRENDRRVGSILAQASDMMGILLQLKFSGPSIRELHGGTIEGRLRDVIENIAQDIRDCGNTIDKYWKSKLIVKFFRSEHWANKFLEICRSFSRRKVELEFALNIRTALRVDIAIDKLEHLIETRSEREVKFEKDVIQRGGREKCLESPDLLVQLLETSEKLEARPQNKSRVDGSSNDANKPTSKATPADERNRLDTLLHHELHAPFHSLLEENRANFMLAFVKQTSRIMDSISSSEARIIRTINTNDIFRQVKDPHLQYIWKQMKWRTNVKTQYFIAELHNYYVDRFSNLCRDAPCTQVTSGAPSWVVPVLSPNYISHFDSGVEELPEIDPADEWCLKYLTILYVPSLSEGFDSDGNRLVSIREVNAFTSAIPQDWSLLQALAYWAAGWWVDSQYYRTCIQEVMRNMVSVQPYALPENRMFIVRYLDSYAIRDMTQLISSPAYLDLEDSDLDLTQLAARCRKARENELADKLNAVKYEIDSTDSIKLFGTGRIEHFLLPLLYLVLERHLQIMKLASRVILVERELMSATQSIKNILEGVDLRVKQLAVIFRQEGTDPKMRFSWYAQGLYDIWFNPDLNSDNAIHSWLTHNSGFDDTELEINTSILKLGPSSLAAASEQFERPVQLVPLDSGRESQDMKEEFIRLWCLNELDTKRWIFGDDVPPRISLEEKRRFDTLSKELPPADAQYWSSLAELHLRTRTTSAYCDACHLQIIDVQYYCADCENNDYYLCVECESLAVSNHKYASKHKATHNMLVFRISRPRILHLQARSYYARNILSALSFVTAPLVGLLVAAEDDTSETRSESSDGPALDTETSAVNWDVYTCAECDVKRKGIFYLCIACQESGSRIIMCPDCAFRDTFNVVKEHSGKHHLVKVKGRVQETDGALEELVDSKKTDETGALAVLSSRVDNLATMVESLDRRIGELMDKLHLSFGLSD